MKTTTSRIRIITTTLVSALVFSASVASAHGHRGPGGHGERMFEKVDVNHDGKITRAEAKSIHDEHFKKMDINKDGSITEEEARAAWKKMRAEMKKRHGGEQSDQGKRHERKEGRQGKEGRGHAAHHGQVGGRFFKKMDANQDGKITRAEADQVQKQRFDAMDTNKDGAVTKAEMKAHFEAKKAEWKEKRENRKANQGQSKKK